MRRRDGHGVQLASCAAGLWATVALCMAAWPAGAAAGTFTAGCSGTTGDAAAFVVAVTQATAVAGSDVVRLSAGCTYTLTTVDNAWYGPNGLPAIIDDLTIEGNGATIARSDTAPPFRFFFVAPDPLAPGTLGYTTPSTAPGGGRLTLRALTVTGGLARGGDSNHGGGGAGLGGAIFSQGIVLVDHCTLVANTAQGGASGNPAVGDAGGGIGTSASTVLPGVVAGGFGPGNFGGAAGGSVAGSNLAAGGAGFGVTEPGFSGTALAAGAGGGPLTGLGGFGGAGAAGGDGSGGGGGGGSGVGGIGGAFGHGGALDTSGGGGAGGGGGVGGGGGLGIGAAGGGGGFGGGGGHAGGDTAGGSGGFGGGGGSAVYASSAVGGGAGFGGGTAVGGSTSPAAHGGGGAGMGGAIFTMQGQLTIRDSTLTSNTAIGGADQVPDHAKGIGGAVFNLNGAFTAIGATFAANTATYGAAQIYNLNEDGATDRVAQTTLVDTIVAGGIGPADAVSSKVNVTHANPGSANLDASRSDLVRVLSTVGAGTVTGTPLTADPLLGPLQANGGPTATMLPGAGSPALDAGPPSGADCPADDQRGVARPQGAACDIGAVETVVPQATTAATTAPPAAPVLSALRLSRRTFRATGALPRSSRRRTPAGTTIGFQLSAPATVTFTFARVLPGRRVSGRCAAPKRANARSPRCTRSVTAGTLVVAGHAGAGAVRFGGRLSRTKRLRPGRYTLSATATGGDGHASAPLAAAFTIVSR